MNYKFKFILDSFSIQFFFEVDMIFPKNFFSSYNVYLYNRILQKKYGRGEEKKRNIYLTTTLKNLHKECCYHNTFIIVITLSLYQN